MDDITREESRDPSGSSDDLVLTPMTEEESEQTLAFGSNDDFTTAWREWKGMPQFSQLDLTPYFSVTLNFASEEDVKAFEALTDQKISRTSSRGIWYPKLTIRHYADKRYRAVE